MENAALLPSSTMESSMPRAPSKPFANPSLEALKSESARAADVGATAVNQESPLTRVLERHRKKLMAIEGVVMVGEGQDEIGRPAIIVGVTEAKFLKRVPASLKGVAVVKRVIGRVNALTR